MQINSLKKVVEYIAGKESLKLVDLLYGKKDINEFLIAKKLSLTINQTRNILYKLSNAGILDSIRKKDKRKGWYIYFWTFNYARSLEVLHDSLQAEIMALEKDLESKKSKRYYKCKICGREVTEEEALLTEFSCLECGEVYALADNAHYILEIEKNKEKLIKELVSIAKELAEEREKNDKKRIKSDAKKTSKKKREAKKAREDKKKLKEKEFPKKKQPSKKKTSVKKKK